MLKLKVLVDNNTFIDEYYLGEPGLSFYIEESGKRILFDTGYSDAFITNAKKMNIDLNNLDYVVLSHGHNDHTGGLRYLYESFDLSSTVLICHPSIFEEKHHKGLEIGSPVQLNDFRHLFKEVILTKEAYKISDHLMYLGQINRVNDFENKHPVGYKIIDNKQEDDYCFDDSALVYVNEQLHIISACSHSGICNICEQAKRLANNKHINTIIGGFHLFENDDVLDKTIAYFKDNEIDNLYPCHCVSLKCKGKMLNELNVKEVGVSLSLERD